LIRQFSSRNLLPLTPTVGDQRVRGRRILPLDAAGH